jgi:NitT/TauT family transport system substrate-binding protein
MKTLSNNLGKLLACAAAVAAFSMAAEAQDKKPIAVLLPNENTTTLYPAPVGKALGFFEDEGIDLTLLASDTTIPYVAFLMNNQADLVMLDAPQTFQAVNAQQPIAVVFEGMQKS